MEEGVSDRKDDNNEKNDEEKYAEFHADSSTVDMEEGVKDITDDKNEIYDDEKEADETKYYYSTKIGEGNEVLMKEVDIMLI